MTIDFFLSRLKNRDLKLPFINEFSVSGSERSLASVEQKRGL